MTLAYRALGIVRTGRDLGTYTEVDRALKGVNFVDANVDSTARDMIQALAPFEVLPPEKFSLVALSRRELGLRTTSPAKTLYRKGLERKLLFLPPELPIQFCLEFQGWDRGDTFVFATEVPVRVGRERYFFQATQDPTPDLRGVRFDQPLPDDVYVVFAHPRKQC